MYAISEVINIRHFTLSTEGKLFEPSTGQKFTLGIKVEALYGIWNGIGIKNTEYGVDWNEKTHNTN